ncbi:unnamed protein product [Notodromas monacha]|uniref:alpha-1,2-Mannosidase n=1 Tax=Notodromas monacha TaxID=399045 RepID=A0A7R9G9B4_9CRUS|nr:unnamed protein product [Notodromas monacha]CAG0912442.1 unnamed protein product [Notodromas monacha]
MDVCVAGQELRNLSPREDKGINFTFLISPSPSCVLLLFCCPRSPTFQVIGMRLSVCLVLFFLRSLARGSMSHEVKLQLRDEAKEMFYHAYDSYMKYAFPADELMPLSCKGRYRGSEPTRGDVDDALGNFTLTLVDTLDTLLVLGDVDEFERSVERVVKRVNFDHDIVVSVFETNIRMVGGLMSGHVLAEWVKERVGNGRLSWYRGELLAMAKDLGLRLLPAFNTTTGLPHGRVNLRFGIEGEEFVASRETCTACAGTMILELAALSRLSGEPVFEEKARKALDALWGYRHRSSDLVGTVLNVHNGDWVRRDSGVGAGIDSYYEYLLKAYILLGDDTLLNRFNKHYQAVMKYVSQGPLLVDVHMHRPHTNSRNFMDALLAFWPGLQVLKGDIKPAIETHEMLYQVMQRHNFLPEAFTTDFQVHWGQHPLRPEFLESTYLLYKATNDPHYLDVGETVLRSLQKYARVPCGFAAVKDVRTGQHEDRMDSFVLAETFKYLFLLFAEPTDLILDLDQFVFTTEAHLLPLSLARLSNVTAVPMREGTEEIVDEDVEADRSCPNIHFLLPETPPTAQLITGTWSSVGSRFAESIRRGLRNFVQDVCPTRILGGLSSSGKRIRLSAAQFEPTNVEHLRLLKEMGISIMALPDGRVQLLHASADAETAEAALEGVEFMQDMLVGASGGGGGGMASGSGTAGGGSSSSSGKENTPQAVSWVSQAGGDDNDPGDVVVHSVSAGPAQFGRVLGRNDMVGGKLALAEPAHGCSDLANAAVLDSRVAVLRRGGCMFVEKARRAARAGAVGAIVIDNVAGTSARESPMFAMSGDGTDDVRIPVVFIFEADGRDLLHALERDPELEVVLAGGGGSNSRSSIASPNSQQQHHLKTVQATSSSSSSSSAPTTATTEEGGRVSRIDLDLTTVDSSRGGQEDSGADDPVVKMNPSLEKMKMFIHEFEQMKEKEQWLKTKAKAHVRSDVGKDVTTVKFLDSGSLYVRETAQGYDSLFAKFMDGLPANQAEQQQQQQQQREEELRMNLGQEEDVGIGGGGGGGGSSGVQTADSIGDGKKDGMQSPLQGLEEKVTSILVRAFQNSAAIQQAISDEDEESARLAHAVDTLRRLREDLKAPAEAEDAEELLDRSIETLRTLSSYIAKVSETLAMNNNNPPHHHQQQQQQQAILLKEEKPRPNDEL